MNFNYLPIYVLTIALGGSFYLGYLPPIIFLIYVIASTLTFFIYAKDKRAAQNDEWRTSESTLHMYSLLFGWPGAIVAQQKLRHKSKKQSFRAAFMFTVLINVSLIVGMHTHSGANMLRSSTNNLKNYITNNVDYQYVRKSALFLFSFRNDHYLYYESDTFYIRES
ncbi:DUF1294 domain-containing protein [Psychromonas sp. MB-3u-54]|uniref:DUF1294 domain-containing protein n=1 Tax=Psychromonas sp. MB-3u-54 TaxID=2058319 RepID=UPI000C3227BB|nr:DUF1294 domain-containing protein [Psychromonas sp. MB-3u-54]PKH03145.1 DUF1294 domain-containing protein [Psychromonas sp. MB-3u-54]